MIRERMNLIIKLYALIDLGIVTFAFVAAYLVRDLLSETLSLPFLMPLSEYLPLLLSILPIWIGLLYLNKTYSSQRGKTYLPLVWTVVKTNVEGVCVLSLIFFVLKLHMFNRSLVLSFVVLCMALLSTEEIFLFKCLQYARKQGRNLKRVLIIGTDPKVQVLLKRINQHPETGFIDQNMKKEMGY